MHTGWDLGPRSWQTQPIELTLLLLTACARGDADSLLDSSTSWYERPEVEDSTKPTGPPLVVWAVRHAEKGDGDDPSLTEEGAERALALAEVLADVPLTAVYATEWVRTQETCQPTASAQGLGVTSDIDPEEELAALVLSLHMGEAVLHCGHSDTIPDFLGALGVEDEEPLSGYGQIWIATMEPDGTATVEMSSFGEAPTAR